MLLSQMYKDLPYAKDFLYYGITWAIQKKTTYLVLSEKIYTTFLKKIGKSEFSTKIEHMVKSELVTVKKFQNPFCTVIFNILEYVHFRTLFSCMEKLEYVDIIHEVL